jgi:DcmR-like sensory protein
MVRERLLDGTLLTVVEQLHKFEFGEHNILVYPDHDTLRELYARHCKKRLETDNEVVVLLPHYLTGPSVRYALQEFEIDVKRYEAEQSLLIMDAINTMFNPSTTDFLGYLSGLESRARAKKKNGICVIADMGVFYHMRKIDDLVKYEASIPSKTELKSNLLCVYHKRDFDRLVKEQQEMICKSHYREIQIRPEREM